MTDAESRRIDELSERLRAFPLDVPDDLDQIGADLRALVGLDAFVSYSVEQGEPGFRLSSWRSRGFGAEGEAGRKFGEFIAGVNGRWGLFDPIRPEPKQQNQPVAILPFATPHFGEQVSGQVRKLGLEAGTERALVNGMLERTGQVFADMGVHRKHQLRVLLCEHGTLLAWVGGFRSEPFDGREMSILRALTPALQARYAMTRTLGVAKVASAALQPVLEQISAPAFVVTAAGTVVFANSAGQDRLERRGDETSAMLRRVGTGFVDGTVTPLNVRGMAPHHLVVLRVPPDAESKLAIARARWKLTERQTTVLHQVALGLSNRAISAALKCAESTVELHITALLSKVEVESRAALVAKFWSTL